MEALTYTQVRKNFAEAMNSVCENHKPIIITRQNRSPVVMMSLEDYNAIEETLYLMRSPRNASRLLRSIANIKESRLKEHDLQDENL
jgi:antitoxin YefM